MSRSGIESTWVESSGAAAPSLQCGQPRTAEGNPRFAHLKGVQWRINLGILPFSSLSSIDDMRRVTADYRRRYAGLRRRLLVDPHLPKDRNNSPNLAMDNPLSQNPDSTWGRFFQSAELEKMADQDLSRLYPENGSYFQMSGCQGMLRRILLLWCLRHPEYGYRQGMHELLAPLLYVVLADVEHLSEVRRLYEDHFEDKFDGLSFHENDLTYDFLLNKLSNPVEDDVVSNGNLSKLSSLDELDSEIQTTVLLSDAYGAEGELGVVLSEKFMEHDVFSMFDALMSGAHGAVAMADFFSPSPASGSQSGLPPVIEASSALYHLLSVVDSSLHSHLVELGVEPQYFALRWLRVLFGREFSLEDLLAIWDEIFASKNIKLNEDPKGEMTAFGILRSPRGAFILAMAVSMLLHLRSSLLATENATSCLRRLLNFPHTVNLKNLIGKARSLQFFALNAKFGALEWSKSVTDQTHSVLSDCPLLKAPLNSEPESYWEEKWKVLHQEEDLKKGSSATQDSAPRIGWSEKLKLRLLRTGSDPAPAKRVERSCKDPRSLVRRNLLKDLSRELVLGDDTEQIARDKDIEADIEGQEGAKKLIVLADERCLSGNGGSDESSSIFSAPTSPIGVANDNESASSVASNLSMDENIYMPRQTGMDESPLPVSDLLESSSPQSHQKDEFAMKSGVELKDRKLLGKLQWFLKLGRRTAAEVISEKGAAKEVQKCAGSSVISGTTCPSLNTDGDNAGQNVLGNLRNLGQSILENIRVIESAIQLDHRQVTTMAAMEELRKIGNLLLEI